MLLLLLSHISRVRLSATPETAAHQVPPSLGSSRQEHWSGLPFPSPMHESEKWKWIRSVVSDSSNPIGLQPTRLLRPWDFLGKSIGLGCHWCHWLLWTSVLSHLLLEIWEESTHRTEAWCQHIHILKLTVTVVVMCVCLVAQSCRTLCDPMDCSPQDSSAHGDSPGKNIGVGGHALLQGIFPMQGLNPDPSHCRQILHHLSHLGSPWWA